MSEAASVDLLNVTLKLDVSKFEGPLRNASQSVAKFKQALDSLSTSAGLRSIQAAVRGITDIGNVSKRSFGGATLTAIRGYKRSVDNLNASLAQSLKTHNSTLAILKRLDAIQDTLFGRSGATRAVAGAMRAAGAMNAIARLTARAFGPGALNPLHAYIRSVETLNHALRDTVRLIQEINATPVTAPPALPPRPTPTKGEPSSFRIGGAARSIANALSRAAGGAARGMRELYAAATQAAAKISTAFRHAAQVVADLGVQAGKSAAQMIRLASDANEAASKFVFVFKDAADKTGKALDDFAEKAGRSRYAMRSMAADIGALIGPMGFTKQKTGELSTAVAKLAVDLSSFWNVSEDDALIALKAGIVGESEPLRRLGVNLNEAKIQQEAFRLGIAKTKDEVDGAVKAQAILSLVFKESRDAQGDAIRTGNQFANTWRTMTEFINQAKTDLGQGFIPVATKYARNIANVAQTVGKWAQANQELLEQRIDDFFERAETFARKVIEAFQSAWKATTKLRDSFDSLRERLSRLVDRGREAFNAMPKWAQDTLLVGGALTGVSVGLTTIGGSIPFLGQFSTALGALLNPVGLIRGAFAVIVPLVTTLGSTFVGLIGFALSPLGLSLVTVAGAFAFLGISIKKALNVSDEANASWQAIKDTFGRIYDKLDTFVYNVKKMFSDWWDSNQEQIARIQDKIGELQEKLGTMLLKVGQKVAEAFEVIADKTLPSLELGLKVVLSLFNDLLDVSEAFVEFMGGGGPRAALLFNSAIIELNKSLIGLLEGLAYVPERFGGFLGGKLAEVIKEKAEVLKMENQLREFANQHFADQVNEDDNRRAKERMNRAIGGAVGSGVGALMNGGEANKGKPAQGGAGANNEEHDPMKELRDDDRNKQMAIDIRDALENGQKEIIKQLTDKYGVINTSNAHVDLARGSASYYAHTARKMEGVDVTAIDAWEKKMLDSLALLKDAPDAMRETFIRKIRDNGVYEDELLAKPAVNAAPDAGAYNVDVTGGVIPGSQFSKHKSAKQIQHEKEVAREEAAAGAKRFAEERVSLYMPSEGKKKQIDTQYKFSSDNPDEVKKTPVEHTFGNVSRQTANKNLANDIQRNRRSDAQTIQALRKRTSGKKGGEQDFMLIAMQLQKAQQLEIQALRELDPERRKMLLMEANQRRQAADAMVKANKDAVTGIKGLQDAAKDAGVDLKKLDDAEQAKLAHEQGQQTPQEQQSQQQMQQFQQQVGNWWANQAQNAAQQQAQGMFEGGQQMLEQALGGPGQVQAMIDEAAATGNMKAAVELIRNRILAQLKQSRINLHNLASDPAAGGGFGSSHGGVSNDEYFMTLDLPLVRLIKFLQAQLDNLPKFAEGGIFTRATAGVFGEAGPEAVLPLSNFADMLGNLPVFAQIHSAMENISDSLAAQGQTALANRWDRTLERVQSTFEYVSSFLDNSRRIDLSPDVLRRGTRSGALSDQSMAANVAGYRLGGLTTGDLALHFHGIDITAPNAARSFARQLLPALEQEARSLGYDATGRSMLRAPGSNASIGGRGFGYAR